MRTFARLRQLFRRPSGDAERSDYNDQLAATAARLAEMRGDRVVAGPADTSPSSGDNVSAAAKDYGLSRFSGESDALAGAADSYRPAASRKHRKKQK